VSALTPYIAVPDARAALRWYAETLGAEPEGEPIVNEDGSVGHAEMRVGGARLMLADSAPDYDSVAPDPARPASVTLHLTVDGRADGVEPVRAGGGRVDREPADSPFGRIAVVRDPFGHRWMFDQPV
jgi:uncharacterized glyoxalase superfamily protein PhnB